MKGHRPGVASSAVNHAGGPPDPEALIGRDAQERGNLSQSGTAVSSRSRRSQPGEGELLDLAHPLLRDLENPAHLCKSVHSFATQAEPERDDQLLPGREPAE